MPAAPKELKTEETDDEKAARYASVAASTMMFITALLGICAVFLPWWAGAAAVANVSSEIGLDAEITLWYHKLYLSVPISPEAPERHNVIYNSDWGIWCSEEELRRREWPVECIGVDVARFFSIATPILALAATSALLYGLLEPLALLAGALVSVLAGLCAFTGAVCGLVVATAGIIGAGFFMLVGCAVLSGVAMTTSLYAATKAMPLDEQGDKESASATRMRRAEMARAEAHELAERLEANLRRPTSPDARSETVGDDGLPKRKPPVSLKRVIEWTHNHGTDESQQVPIELLEEAFREIDKDGSRFVDLDELVEALRACDLPASQAATRVVLNEISKNDTGEIDVHEFVDFFRNIEELGRFQHKTQQRAQFLGYVCSACFLAHIVIVGVLLMIFINMDQASTPEDNYSIMKNAIIVFSCILGLLFISVIAIPAARLTLGANMVAWQRHYDKRFTKGKKKRGGPAQGEGMEAEFKGSLKEVRGNKPLQQGGLRQSAWGSGADEAATVNAAIYGSSYRVRKAQAELAKLNRDYKECPNGCGFSGTREEAAKHEYVCPLRRRQSVVSADAPPGSAPPPPGIILNDEGEFQCYDPLAFRLEQTNQNLQQVPQTFISIAGHDTRFNPAEAGRGNGMLALEYNGGAMASNGFGRR